MLNKILTDLLRGELAAILLCLLFAVILIFWFRGIAVSFRIYGFVFGIVTIIYDVAIAGVIGLFFYLLSAPEWLILFGPIGVGALITNARTRIIIVEKVPPEERISVPPEKQC